MVYRFSKPNLGVTMAPKRSPKKRVSKSRSKSRKVSKSRSRSRSVKKKVHKWQVLKGSAAKTVGGLGAEDLKKNKHGKVVSKKKHALSKQRAQTKGSWVWCVKKARADLKVTGFCPIKKGTPLYIRAKLLFNNGGDDPEAGKGVGKKSPKKAGKVSTVSNSGGWSALGC